MATGDAFDTAVGTSPTAGERLRRNATLIRSMLGLHPRPFVVSFVGAAIFGLATVASSFGVRWMIDNVIVERFESDVSTATFLTGATIIVVIGVVRAIGVVFRRAAASTGMWRVAQTYTDQVTDRLVRQPLVWHRRRPDGDLVARGGVDAETAVSVIAPIPFASSTVLMVVVSTVWLFLIDVPLGVVALIVFPTIIAMNVVYERSVSAHFTHAQNALGRFSAAVHESFEGVQLVKSYGAESRETSRLSAVADEVRGHRIRALTLRTWFESAQETLPAVANIGLVVLGAIRVDSGDVTIGEFSSVIFLFGLLALPVRLIGYALSELPRSMAAWVRIQEVTDEPIEPDPADCVGEAPAGIGLAFDGVSYAYEGSDTLVLDGVDLHVATGSITAVVGPTASGKTTLAQLALGLAGPTAGVVAAASGPKAIVFQEAFLLAGSIRDNVAFGRPVSDDRVHEALRVAAAEFVGELPSGLDTIVGERGISLSGGQRQRVALARAVVERPALLVLDDTPTALDPATEATVLERLRDELTDTTVLLVASRPSTIALADEVAFLDAGRVMAHGPHETLVREVAAYRALVEAFEADRAGDRADDGAGDRAVDVTDSDGASDTGGASGAGGREDPVVAAERAFTTDSSSSATATVRRAL
ncbi:MAG: ABC transporter ATP-binding protein, partial [Actinomycetota bacterium]